MPALPPTAAHLGRAWRVDDQVALRPESFGALAYHFGTRRLSFLKSRVLFQVVQTLEKHSTALGACRAAGVTDAELPHFEQALEALAESGMIALREPQ